MKKSKYLILLLALLLLVSCGAPQQRPMEERPKETNLSAISRTKPVEYCRITADTADVRTGTGHTFDTIGTLKRDDIVKVLSEVENWYVVQLDNNTVGSIETTKATPVVMENDRTVTPPGINPNTPLTDTTGETNRDQLFDPRRSPDAEDATQPNDTPTPAQDITGEPQIPRGTGEAGGTGGTGTNNAPQPGITNTNPAANNTAGNLSNMAAQLVSLVNNERQKNGLPALTVDTEVARVAGIKSQDMVDNDYFSHNSPTYGSPFEMLDSFGIKYLHAGENLAGHRTVQSAHEALMNSAGHRQNILSNDYTHIGIGVRPSNRYGYVFTQLFISKPR